MIYKKKIYYDLQKVNLLRSTKSRSIKIYKKVDLIQLMSTEIRPYSTKSKRSTKHFLSI